MAATGKGIRAGKAYVELIVDNKIAAGLRSAQKQINALGATLFSAGAKLAAVGAAMVAPLAMAGRAFSNFGDQFDKMSIRTGVSVEALSELAFAADRSGTSIEDLELGIRQMQKSMSGDAEKNLMAMAERLKAIQDPSVRAATAMEVFGRSGTKLLPLLLDDVIALRAEARRLGLTWSTLESRQAADLNDALGDMHMSLRRVWVTIGSAMAPMMERMAKAIANIGAATGRWVRQNQGVVISVGMAGAAMGAAAVAAYGLGAAMKVLAVAAVAVSLAVSAIGFLLTPLGLVTAAAVAGGAAWLKWSESGQRATAGVKSAMVGLAQTAKAAWGGIRDALAAGDMAAAAGVMWAGLRVAWAQGTQELGSIWRQAMAGVVKFTAGAWGGIQAAAEILWNGLRVAWIEGSAALKTVFATLLSWHQKATESLTSGIVDAWISVEHALGRITAKEAEERRKYAAGQSNLRYAEIDRERDQAIAQAEQDRTTGRSAEMQRNDTRMVEIGERYNAIAAADDANAADGVLAAKGELERAKAELAGRVTVARGAAAALEGAPKLPDFRGVGDALMGYDRKLFVAGAFGAAAGRLGGDTEAKRSRETLEKLLDIAKRQLKQMGLPTFE